MNKFFKTISRVSETGTFVYKELASKLIIHVPGLMGTCFSWATKSYEFLIVYSLIDNFSIRGIMNLDNPQPAVLYDDPNCTKIVLY